MNLIKTISERKIRGPFVTFTFMITILFDVILMSLKNGNDKTAWSEANIFVDTVSVSPAIYFVFGLLFVLSFAVSIIAIVSAFSKKVSVWSSVAVTAAHITMLVMLFAFELDLSVALLIVSLLFSLFPTAYNVICSFASEKGERPEHSVYRMPMLISSIIVLLISLSLFYVPFAKYTFERDDFALRPMSVFAAGKEATLCLAMFLGLLAFVIIAISKFLSAIRCYANEISDFADKVQSLINFVTIGTGAYFGLSVIICALRSSKGEISYSTNAYVPFLIMTIFAILSAILVRRVSSKAELSVKGAKFARVELLIYSLAVSGVTIFAVLGDIMKATITSPVNVNTVYINGYKLLMTYNSIESGLQLMAFVVFAILVITIAIAVASLISFLSGSKVFYKIAIAELICGGVFTLMISMFSKYYEIVQKINNDMMTKIISDYVKISGELLTFKVTDASIQWFILVAGIIVIALIRKPYSRGTVGEADIMVQGTAHISGGGSAAAQGVAAQIFENDPCPAFTELDMKSDEFAKDTASRKNQLFQNPTLPALVKFIVNYARDSRLHLYYTEEDIATFIAGLGATRLSILQGMSGTGKTSLPKIFAEAILGNCEIIEVESSWRDKNELLGYYNEFSKIYTPKKFTQALYKAKLNPETVTFIVLDEMNLSRIEYYFSDFLSLMENEEDKRTIKLLNVGLFKNVDGTMVAYKGLTDGHTVQIPNNIWFVGTANRDESTFEISDKVYDRAHTMNFNKRAAKPMAFGDAIPQRYLTVKEFTQLINNAKSNIRFDIDNFALVKDIEMLLAPYNISFGNRIAKQIESFVSVYCACFDSPQSVASDAFEKILLSKVVSKLEFKSVENKTQLAAEFEKRNLHRCSEFILKLNED